MFPKNILAVLLSIEIRQCFFEFYFEQGTLGGSNWFQLNFVCESKTGEIPMSHILGVGVSVKNLKVPYIFFCGGGGAGSFQLFCSLVQNWKKISRVPYLLGGGGWSAFFILNCWCWNPKVPYFLEGVLTVFPILFHPNFSVSNINCPPPPHPLTQLVPLHHRGNETFKFFLFSKDRTSQMPPHLCQMYQLIRQP